MRNPFFLCFALLLFNLTKAYRFNSSFTSANTRAMWYVDGQDYMSAVADAIEAASTEIFIAGWQMNPSIFMKRPSMGINSESLKWRLDNLLIKKANEGVKIYILLYGENEFEFIMDLGGKFVKKYLQHENITIFRHPCYNFVDIWSHHEKTVVVDGKIAFVSGIDLAFGRWDTHNHVLTDNYPVNPCVKDNKDGCKNNEVRYCRWIGKDYGNTFLRGDRTRYDLSMDDYVDRETEPRMPWHDIGCSFTGLPAHNIRKYLIQRYNSHLYENCDFIHIFLSKFWRCDINCSHYIKISKLNYTAIDFNGYEVSVQVLQSGGYWSEPEASIHNAYLEMINSSKYNIYIENQYFISSTQEKSKVENQIMSAIAERILFAFKHNEDFHFTLVMPLMPEIYNTARRDSMGQLNYETLIKEEKSFCNRLEDGGIPKNNIFKYFSMYGLRTYGTLNDNLVTEIIYVHSKLMIVDDRKTIIGSANINDRSMSGNRDSEIAVMIEDMEMIDSKMNGHLFQVGKFSHYLRCHLMKEHLGLLESKEYKVSAINVEDPLDTSFLKKIQMIAKHNSEIYKTVFGGKISPTNDEQSYEQQKFHQSKRGLIDKNQDEAKRELRKIKGSIVDFPESYLKDESRKVLASDSYIEWRKGFY